MNTICLALLLSLAQQAPKAGIAAWDTNQTSADAPDVKPGWTSLTEPATTFKGDAVITNGRVTVVVRKQSTSAEVYA